MIRNFFQVPIVAYGRNGHVTASCPILGLEVHGETFKKAKEKLIREAMTVIDAKMLQDLMTNPYLVEEDAIDIQHWSDTGRVKVGWKSDIRV